MICHYIIAKRVEAEVLQRLGIYGEIAQLARARGSYPRCRGFKSPSRYGSKAPDFPLEIRGFLV